MLNLNCVICAELFAHTDDVHVTICGHMFHYVCLSQWLERSKTCPQCRNKCSERNIIRLYFNLANLDASSIDVGSLQEQLDNSKLLLQMKEKELKKSDEQIRTLKDSQKKCMKTITGLEDKLKKNEFVLLSYTEQIKMLKTEAKVVEDLRKEVKSLKQQLEAMEGVSCILAASCEEAEKLLKNERDPKKLSVWVTTLKRELRNCDSKNTNIRNMLRVVQSDLRQETNLKKKLEERISQLESECYQLSEEIKKSEKPSSSGSKIIRDTTIANGESNYSNFNFMKQEKKNLTISPTIKETVRKIEESDSPYLNIKSSSVGLMPYAFKRNQETGLMGKDVNTAVTTTKLAYLKVSPTKSAGSETGTLRKMSSDLTEKYSILKRPRLVLSATSATTRTTKPISSNLVFNGFGGSDKISPFERNSENDDSVIAEDGKASKSFRNMKSNATNNIGVLRKTNSSNGSNLSERLKSGGLRNFMLSNRSNNETTNHLTKSDQQNQLKKSNSIFTKSLSMESK